MEQPVQEKSLFSLRIDETAKDHLRKIALWATIIVVLAVIGYVINILTFISVKNQPVEYEGFSVSVGSSKNIAGLIFGLVIGLLINYFLFQFASFAKKGVNNSSQPDIARSFGNLKIYFAFIGVLLIIALVFVFLGILAGGI